MSTVNTLRKFNPLDKKHLHFIERKTMLECRKHELAQINKFYTAEKVSLQNQDVAPIPVSREMKIMLAVVGTGGIAFWILAIKWLGGF